MSEAFEKRRWENLPEHIIVHIMSFLPMVSRYKASLTCRMWNNCFQTQYLWGRVEFHFYSEADARFLQCVPKYGQHLRSLSIQIDQQLSLNRDNACQVIRDLAKFRKLQKLNIKFIGENPYFYAGIEFIDALKLLFAAVNQPGTKSSNETKKENCKTDTDGEAEENDHDESKPADGKSKADTANLNEQDGASAANINAILNTIEDFDESSNLSNNSIYLPSNVNDPGLIREGQLREVDLSGLTVCIDDSLISLLSLYHHKLEKLNIQNKVLVVKVSPSCILQLVQNCRKLRDLRLYMCSMSQNALECFADDDRMPLEHLSLFCRREEKYGKELGENVWKEVVKKLPRLQVTLIFDHTCPLFRINEIMKPQIPVSVLRLETFTYIYDEVQQAAHYYSKCLEKLVLETPLSRNSPELNAALITLAEKCHKLKSLHVFCVLEESTIDRILELHPKMKEEQTYTLKHTQEPHPWYAGRDAL